MKNNVVFADDNIFVAEAIGNISINMKNGEYSFIKYVLYISGIKCNLLSIGHFLERNYKIHMENKVLKVMDANGSLILKAHMAQNRTFKVELKVMEHKYLATSASREE